MNDPKNPFDKFKVHPFYDDFTMPTFDGRHNIFKGGSWISCGNESRRSARYAFRKHFFQHAGFRYVIAEELERGGYRYRSFANECDVYDEVSNRREPDRFLYEMVVQDSASAVYFDYEWGVCGRRQAGHETAHDGRDVHRPCLGMCERFYGKTLRTQR